MDGRIAAGADREQGSGCSPTDRANLRDDAMGVRRTAGVPVKESSGEVVVAANAEGCAGDDRRAGGHAAPQYAETAGIIALALMARAERVELDAE